MTNVLRAVAKEVQLGRLDAAERLLSVVLSSLERRTDPLAIQSSVFAAAMARTLSQSAGDEANLYLQDYEVPQIRLFELLVTRVPVVGWARLLGNAILADLCRGEPEVTLIDIGIGVGSQEVALLHQIAKAPGAPKRVTVVAIECQVGSLDEAEWALKKASEETGIEVRLVKLPMAVEDLDERDWSLIECQPGCKILRAAPCAAKRTRGGARSRALPLGGARREGIRSHRAQQRSLERRLSGPFRRGLAALRCRLSHVGRNRPQ